NMENPALSVCTFSAGSPPDNQTCWCGGFEQSVGALLKSPSLPLSACGGQESMTNGNCGFAVETALTAAVALLVTLVFGLPQIPIWGHAAAKMFGTVDTTVALTAFNE